MEQEVAEKADELRLPRIEEVLPPCLHGRLTAACGVVNPCGRSVRGTGLKALAFLYFIAASLETMSFCNSGSFSVLASAASLDRLPLKNRLWTIHCFNSGEASSW